MHRRNEGGEIARHRGIAINQTIQNKSVEGIVEDINLRSTRIKCSDGSMIIVPNNLIATGIVKNKKR